MSSALLCQTIWSNCYFSDYPIYYDTKQNAKSYSEPRQTSNNEIFTKMVNGFQPLTIFAKSSIFDVWIHLRLLSNFRNDYWPEGNPTHFPIFCGS